MKAFKFFYKKERKRISFLAIIVSSLAILILLQQDIIVNKSIVYFIASIVSFIYIMTIVNKAKKNIEDIQVEESNVKIYFLNKMTDPITVQSNQVRVEIDSAKIIFRYRSTNKLLAIALKESMEEPERWQELVHEVMLFASK